MTDAKEDDPFAPYEELAMEICGDPRGNDHRGIPMSNEQISNAICDLLGRDSFDLFAEEDPKELESTKDSSTVQAHTFLHFLRWELYAVANANDVGNKQFTLWHAAYNEYWYNRLSSYYKSLVTGEEIDLRWIQ